TITKSISIDCDSGAGGGFNAGKINGIVINANAATDTIILRKLTIQGTGRGLNGKNLIAARSLPHEHAATMGQSVGILVNATTSTNLTGLDVKINNCTTGISVTTTSGNAIVDFANSQISGNTTGVLGRSGSLVTIKDSVLSINTNQAVNQNTGG